MTGGNTLNFNAPVATVNAPAGDMTIIQHDGLGEPLLAKLNSILAQLDHLTDIPETIRSDVRVQLEAARPVVSDPNQVSGFLDNAVKTLESTTKVGAQGLKLAKGIEEIVAWVGSLAG